MKKRIEDTIRIVKNKPKRNIAVAISLGVSSLSTKFNIIPNMINTANIPVGITRAFLILKVFIVNIINRLSSLFRKEVI